MPCLHAVEYRSVDIKIIVKYRSMDHQVDTALHNKAQAGIGGEL